MQIPGTQAERDRVNAQYAKHAEERRAARRARYYANLSAERAGAAMRMRDPRAYKRRRLMRLDDRWLKWARDVGVRI